MNETELARAIASGEVPSPQQCGGFWLFALRFTGTGTVWREAHQETAFRSPDDYLTPEFLERTRGVPLVADHPDGKGLDGAEFDARTIGTCGYAYIATPDGIEGPFGNEVWTIARVYSDAAVEAMTTYPLSTSPAVIFRKAEAGPSFEMKDGTSFLIEGVPAIIDHLAVCVAGVFDRGGPPTGIRLDSERTKIMTPEEKAEAEKKAETETAADRARKDAEFPGEKLDKLLTHLDSVTKMCDGISRRMDAFEAATKARKDDGTDAAPDDGIALDGPPGTPRRVAADAEAERKEAGEKAEIQARADSVALAHGERASAPMMGETTQAYRHRLARGFQRHSREFKGIDLKQTTGAVFDAIETKIYADAMVAAACPDVAPGGVLREINRVDPATGQRITSFYSHNNATTFISLMKRPSRRLIGINTPNSGRS